MSATKIGSRLLARCCERGLDSDWLTSLRKAPRPTKGSKMSISALRALSGTEAIARKGQSRGTKSHGAVALWGPGKNYDALMKRLEGRA